MSDMTDELKPVRCGCGGEAQMMFNQSTPSFPYYVRCKICDTRSNLFTTEAEAITAWNRAMSGVAKNATTERTAKVETYTDDQQETWSVCECGTDVWKSYNYCPECGARLEWE